MRDRAKVLKYIESTNAEYGNEKELVLKLSHLFKSTILMFANTGKPQKRKTGIAANK